MHEIITIGSATRDVFMTSRALHPHRAKDAIAHIEACFPFGAKINVENIFFTTGGGATNNAVTFSRLGGFRAAAICRIAKDSSGSDVLEGLKKNRVDLSLVQSANDPHEHTAYSVILSPGGEFGERTILAYRGASKKFDHKKIPWSKLRAKWFYISSLGGDLALLRKLIARAKKIGAGISFNPGGQELKNRTTAKQLFPQLDFLILNREESAKLTRKKFEDTKGLLRALTTFAPRAIMTDGPNGAYAAIKNKKAYYVPSVGHKPKNLTGAGDAFGSGFVTGWIKSRGNIEFALRLGSFNADSVVQKTGAKAGILDKIPTGKTMNKLPVKDVKF